VGFVLEVQVEKSSLVATHKLTARMGLRSPEETRLDRREVTAGEETES
jgi:hypothetical protein